MNRSVRYQVMPPLSPDEYQDLYDDIKANGVMVPVLEDEDGVIIDGHHRAKIASELGIPCPVELVESKTEAEKRGMAFTLNLKRRHLNREQRRHLIAESLKKDPQLSNREHARRTGANHETVGSVRKGMESTGEIRQSNTRLSADGRERPASQPKREASPDQPPHEPTADELNAPNPPRIPDPVAPPPATTTEDKPPTQTHEQQTMTAIMAHLNQAERHLKEATLNAYKLTNWTGAPLSQDLRNQLDELDNALANSFDTQMQHLIEGENR